MDLTINWSNQNGGSEDGVRVYRDIVPMTDGALPAPIATLAAGSTSYVDSGVTHGSKYYYRIGIFKDTDEVLTKNRAIRAVSAAETGPGPQTLKAGDWDLGWFGLVRTANLITYSDLASSLGITVGTVMPERDWLKLAYKGKVLFIARQPARYSIAYNTLYLAGAVYGTNDNGLVVPAGGVTPTNQYRPITIAGTWTMVPRILQGLPNTAAAVPAADANNYGLAADPGSNEWDDIMGVLTQGAVSWGSNLTSGRFTQLRDELQGAGSNAAFVDLCQQAASIANNISFTRGGRYNLTNLYYPSAILSATPGTVSSSSRLVGGYGGISAVYCWRPVLEVVI